MPLSKNIEEIFDLIYKESDSIVFLKHYGDLKGKVKYNGVSLVLLSREIEKLLQKEAKEEGKKIGQGEVQNNVGFLRQWLNEDRITDSSKMITNEDIEHWIFSKTLHTHQD